MTSTVDRSTKSGGPSLGTKQPNLCNLEAPREDWPDIQENQEQQNLEFLEAIIGCILLCYSDFNTSTRHTNGQTMRNALRDAMKSRIDGDMPSSKITLIQPFPESKSVTANIAISYYLALDTTTVDENLVRNGVSDLIRWAWDCLPSAGNLDTCLYLGLIIAQALYSIRKNNMHRRSGERIHPLNPSMPLDPQCLTTWMQNIISSKFLPL